MRRSMKSGGYALLGNPRHTSTTGEFDPAQFRNLPSVFDIAWRLGLHIQLYSEWVKGQTCMDRGSCFYMYDSQENRRYRKSSKIRRFMLFIMCRVTQVDGTVVETLEKSRDTALVHD